MKRIWTTPIVKFLGTRGMFLLLLLVLAAFGLVLHQQSVESGSAVQAMLGQ